MNFELAKQSYIDHLRIERGLAAHTIESYRRDISRYGLFLTERQISLTSVTPDDLVAFSVTLKDAKLATSSINRMISGVKGFHKYLLMEKSISDPTIDFVQGKISRKLPKALTVSEITALIDSVKVEGDALSLRDFAILELLYSSGARVSELIGVNIGDISTIADGGEEIAALKLRGKGAKERIVPLGKFARVALDEYLIRTRPALSMKNKRGESALFLNSRGSRLSRQSAWQIVLTAADATGLTGRVSPHVFRHSYATHLLDGGADIRVVQELLGHASVTTTQIYTLITIDKVRESYSLAHPRAN